MIGKSCCGYQAVEEEGTKLGMQNIQMYIHACIHRYIYTYIHTYIHPREHALARPPAVAAASSEKTPFRAAVCADAPRHAGPRFLRVFFFGGEIGPAIHRGASCFVREASRSAFWSFI